MPCGKVDVQIEGKPGISEIVYTTRKERKVSETTFLGVKFDLGVKDVCRIARCLMHVAEAVSKAGREARNI